ncbi:hypothetical protein CEV34_3574 [Brucella pseudogrignonensis]|uniref:Uncharacterized protein n=1 Tax=Brucella pseudogrignonensis TaxID=419475 RepID=A0A256G9D6_9HYPH|nr:hypothetical protein CEV34_3574 [Brucella pseudogrignonensis]
MARCTTRSNSSADLEHKISAAPVPRWQASRKTRLQSEEPFGPVCGRPFE